VEKGAGCAGLAALHFLPARRCYSQDGYPPAQWPKRTTFVALQRHPQEALRERRPFPVAMK